MTKERVNKAIIDLFSAGVTIKEAARYLNVPLLRVERAIRAALKNIGGGK